MHDAGTTPRTAPVPRTPESALAADVDAIFFGTHNGSDGPLPGDRVLFARLYAEHKLPLARLARRYLADARDVDEVVQETFLRLFLALPELETEAQVAAWSRRTATNLCIDRYRAERRRPSVVDLDHVPDALSAEWDDDPLVAAEDAAIVRAALADLPPLYRKALIAREIEELPLDAIAARLDVEPAQMKHLLHRARRALRKNLEAKHGPALAALMAVIMGVFSLVVGDKVLYGGSQTSTAFTSLPPAAGGSVLHVAPSVPDVAPRHHFAAPVQVPVTVTPPVPVTPVVPAQPAVSRPTHRNFRATKPKPARSTGRGFATLPAVVAGTPAFGVRDARGLHAAQVNNMTSYPTTDGGRVARSTIALSATTDARVSITFDAAGGVRSVTVNPLVPSATGATGYLLSEASPRFLVQNDGSTRIWLSGYALPMSGSSAATLPVDLTLTVAVDRTQVLAETLRLGQVAAFE